MPIEKQSLNNFLPNGFETLNQEGYKENFNEEKIKTGYEKDVPDIVSGPNLNNLIDVVGKNTNILNKYVEYLNNMHINSIPTVDNNNQLNYVNNNFLNKTQITNCILEAPNGVATYEGNVITAKAGLKVLLCDGKNADGTYKNIEYTLASDISLTNGTYITDKRFISVTGKGDLAFDDGANFVFGTKEPANPHEYLCWYNPDTNLYKIWLNNMWDIQNRAVIGWFTATSSTITSLTVYSTINLLKQSDKSQISGWSMPSDKFVPLTFGPSDSIYIAPASGRFSIRAKATAPYAFMNLLNLNNGLLDISDLTLANDECGLSVEAKKGDRVGIYYANFTVPSTGYFRFIYAEGEA